MSIAHCLINSKVGDIVVYSSAEIRTTIIKKSFILAYKGYPAGLYPQAIGLDGEMVISLHPINFKIIKIIKCQ